MNTHDDADLERCLACGAPGVWVTDRIKPPPGRGASYRTTFTCPACAVAEIEKHANDGGAP